MSEFKAAFKDFKEGKDDVTRFEEGVVQQAIVDLATDQGNGDKWQKRKRQKKKDSQEILLEKLGEVRDMVGKVAENLKKMEPRKKPKDLMVNLADAVDRLIPDLQSLKKYLFGQIQGEAGANN